jgi:zinc transport system substrate-binding protein
MRTRIILITAEAMVAALALTGCGGSDSGGSASGASNDRTDVVAGFYPLAWAAEQVGGDRVEVTNLTPAGAAPHDLELSVRDAERVRVADLVLYLGAGLQPALEEAAARTDGVALDLLESVDVREGDPHVWLDPLRYAAIVERLGSELRSRQAAAKLAADLKALDREYARGLSDCERRAVVTAHDAFGYLAERYHLDVIPIAGVSPESEPSPQDLERVADEVRSSGATTVFVEPLLSPEIAEVVARETGARTEALNPLEGLNDEELGRGENYLSVMRANLAALREGLGCR